MAGPSESDAAVFNQRSKPPVTPNRQMINNPGNIWVRQGWAELEARFCRGGREAGGGAAPHSWGTQPPYQMPSPHHLLPPQGRFYATLGREYVVPGTWEARKSFLAM